LVTAQLPICYSIDSPDAPPDTEINVAPDSPIDPDGASPYDSSAPQSSPQFFPTFVAPPPNLSNQMEPVIFSAVRASDRTRQATQKVYFDNTITDVGYGWYPQRNEFICYYPGTYFFTFSALTAPNSQLKYVLHYLNKFLKI